MPVPQNAQTIWAYLSQQGLTSNAVAGIEGNIEQESGGNPAAGVWPSNYGLIQWTPASSYFSGPPSLQQQLPAIVKYIQANGSVSDINQHASSPQNAALWFSQHYERPLASAANNPNREQSAADTAAAAKSGKWPQSATLTSASGLNPNPLDLFGIPSTAAADIGGAISSGFSGIVSGFLNSIGVSSIKDLLQRTGLILLGVAVLLIGIHILSSDGNKTAQNIDIIEQVKGSSNKSGKTKSAVTGGTSAKSVEKTGLKSVGGVSAGEAIEAAAVA